MDEQLKNMKFNIQNEKNVTKHDIVREMEAIWEEVQGIWNGIKPITVKQKKQQYVKISETDHKMLDSIFDRVRSEHKDLYMAYPTVLRHMIQEKQYNPKVFRSWMDKVEKAPWIDDKTKYDMWTDYAVMLYIDANCGRHPNKTVLESF